MAHINLLPWRDAARKEKQKEFLIILGAAAGIAFLIMFSISSYFAKRIEGQLKRNAFIETQTAVLDTKIAEIRKLEDTKKSLQQRMALIEQLQSSRNLGTQVFSEVANTVPPGIYLSELEKKNDAVLVVGQSESNNRLSHMIRQIEASELLKFVNLQSITAGTGASQVLSDFTMQLEVESFKLEAQEDDGAKESTP